MTRSLKPKALVFLSNKKSKLKSVKLVNYHSKTFFAQALFKGAVTLFILILSERHFLYFLS